MGLKFTEILKLFVFLFGVLWILKDDDATCPITKTYIFTCIVEADHRYDVFLHYFLIGSFVAEYLGVFVICALAWGNLIHSSINY